MPLTRRTATLFGAALVLACSAPVPVLALALKTVEVRIDPSRSDRFLLAGRYDALALEGATDLVVRIGGFELRAPVANMVRRGKKLRLRGTKIEPGLGALAIDTSKRSFGARGLNLVLAAAPGPVAVELGTDLGTECALVTLGERSRKRGQSRRTFKREAKEVAGRCGVVGAPTVSPGAVVAGEPTAVTVTAAVTATPEAGSVRLLRLDTRGRPVEPALCVLLDDGAAGVDTVAGDGVFGCQLTVTEAEPATLALVVEARIAGAAVRSPGATLDVAAPLSEADVDRILDIQAQTVALWEQAVAEHGDTLRARVETARALRALAGVGAVNIAGAGSIEVACPGGVPCGLLIPTGGDPATPVPDAAPAAAGATLARAAATPGAIRPLATGCDEETRQTIKNQQVLIWDSGLLGIGSPTPFIDGVYRSATCPRLTVEVDTSGTVASVGRFGAFGTVVIVTHGAPGAFATREEVSRDAVDEIRRTKKLPPGLRVLVVGGRTDVLDVFFRKNVWAIDMATAPVGMFGSLDGTVVFGAFCESAVGATPSGAGAYAGYTSVATFGWFQANARSFAANMVERYEILPAAVRDASPAVAPLVGARLRSFGGPLAYLGNAMIEPALANLPPNGMQTFQVRIEGGDDSGHCDMKYKWRNDADHGHLRGGFPPGEDEFESRESAFSPPVDEATYTADAGNPGLDNITVTVEPADAAAAGSDDTRFGETCGQAIVSDEPRPCLTDCQLNSPGCVADGVVEQNPSCCCSCVLRIGEFAPVCACQDECCLNFPECEPAGTDVIHFSACCSCAVEGLGLMGKCK